MTLNRDDEAQIRARLIHASSGPWAIRKHPDHDAPTIYSRKGGGYIIHPALGYVNDDSDADLIAHSPTDIEALLAEIDRLRART